MQTFSPMLERGVVPNRLPDTVWLEQFLAKGESREAILLGLGERWEGTPSGLLWGLRDVPAFAHGYQLSAYGLPWLRAVLRDYIRDTHRLSDYDDAFEVAVSWTGTRSVMRDFGQLVRARNTGRALSAVVVGPAWDYAGVLEPSGFDVRYMDPTASSSWVPTAEMVEEFTQALKAPPTLVVINAQHNPTGLSWEPSAVRALVRLAVEHRAGVLLDDAYYGFLDSAEQPTSALLELLREAGDEQFAWCAVRSLGKQFNCNGWALGAITAPPSLLDDLVNEMRAAHTYNHGGHLQTAMAHWLSDRAAVEAFLAHERSIYQVRRQKAIDGLVAGGVPDHEIVAGPAGPYLLYPVPANYADRGRYLERCAVETGVFMSDAWPSTRRLEPRSGRHIRMYLGRSPELISDACMRLAEAGLLTTGKRDQ
ncbi:aminotransferase class I/II-fold pyridoxal phosphate-dependent enzyme [Nonomuraea sp. NPDC050643]|uniref:pyridoxal phosphate-dependent aminotransferase n=1 Tax=Nonomuraea sp. NPDC050643 TaxID=3155660 RepID=UPI0033DFB594